jgi:hypothetical protein
VALERELFDVFSRQGPVEYGDLVQPALPI